MASLRSGCTRPTPRRWLRRRIHRHGPVRTQLGMNSRGNVLGPGNSRELDHRTRRAPDTDQCHGAVPGAGNEALVAPGGRPSSIAPPLATGQVRGIPHRRTKRTNPGLRPLHVERGFAAEQSVVTVFATVGICRSLCTPSRPPTTSSRPCATTSSAPGRLGRTGFCVVVIPPENADIFVRDGWSKGDIRGAIFAGTTRSLRGSSSTVDHSPAAWMDRRGHQYSRVYDDIEVAIAATADDVLVVVAGGPAELRSRLFQVWWVRHVRDPLTQ